MYNGQTANRRPQVPGSRESYVPLTAAEKKRLQWEAERGMNSEKNQIYYLFFIVNSTCLTTFQQKLPFIFVLFIV